MDARQLVVTGAFGFTGQAVAARLLSAGHSVRTLTNHPQPGHPFADRVPASPLNFADPDGLARSMEGCETLVNTYWIRFARGSQTFDQAVRNTRTLMQAAARAGVRRVVHISIANPDASSRLPYYSAKARAEETVRETGLSYAIVRPTLLFGPGDILLNNIAWMLRRYPVFAVPGSGSCRVQPVFLGDLADMIVASALGEGNEVLDAAGPEIMTFMDLVRLLAKTVKSYAWITPVPGPLALWGSRALGVLMRDVVMTADELAGLQAELLVSNEPPRGTTRLRGWLAANAAKVGMQYASELKRHYL